MRRPRKSSKAISATGLIVLLVSAFAGNAFGQKKPKSVYVANQNDNAISAYAIDGTTGALTAVTGSPFAAGAAPLSVTVDPSGRFAYAANECLSVNPFDCSSGTVSAYTIDHTTGALTAVAGSPFAAGMGAFYVTVDPSGKFAYVTNDTVSGNVLAYTIDSTTGALTAVAGSPFAAGAVSLSVAVDPSGKFAYVTNQCDTSNSCSSGLGSVSAYTINSTTGALTAVSGSPFAAGVFPRVMAVDPSGKFAYTTNQCISNNFCSSGIGSVSAYSINSTTGALSPITGSPFAAGSFPTSVAVDPLGKFAYVANQCISRTPMNCSSGTVSAYTIDSTTGALTAVTGSPFAAGTDPLSVAVDPSGKFAYVANECISSNSCSNGTVSAYTIDGTTGALTAVTGSPFAAGAGPISVAIGSQSVETPSQLITDLGNTVNSFNLPVGFDNSLDEKLQAAQASLAANHVNQTCRHIDAFTNEVTAQSGKKLTVDQANQLLTQANFIENSLGCR